jgi:hypothetical protein
MFQEISLPEKYMNMQRILADETKNLCLMSWSDSVNAMMDTPLPDACSPVQEGPCLPFPCLAFGDGDEDEDIEDDEDNFDDMEDDFDDDFDDDDDDFDDDEDDDFDDDAEDDYDYDDDADYDDDFEE